jgi:D-beta-D-heptose 7-phosphate kinase/D-beta-D-heptose 1-phosphate adenosyltransferase
MPQIKIIGESCLDIFVYCDAIRLAPDLPVPVLQKIHTETNPGMAANVERNINARSISTELVTNENWNSFVKTRYVHDKSNHMFFRVDTPQQVARINLKNFSFESEVIVISDYNKGFLTESDIEYICSSHPFVFIDTKKILGSWAEKAKYIKINDYEFKNSQSYLTDNLVSKIIHTRGADGCDYLGKNFPVERFEIRDTSGAGDSFMAALVAEFLKSSDIEKSIKAANIAASEVVRTRGVGVI